MNRRILLTGLGAMLCAPAIVRASSLMPVRPFDEVRYKAYERFLVGNYGTIEVLWGDPSLPTHKFRIGASELIMSGDCVVLDKGYGRPLRPHEYASNNVNVIGIAITDSKHVYRNMLKPSKAVG